MTAPRFRYMCALVLLSSFALTLDAAGPPPRSADALLAPEAFDMTFFREFARNGLEDPSHLQAIRRWLQPPNVYLKVVDEAGRPIDETTLKSTESVLIGSAPIWTGGQFGLNTLVRGSGTREDVPGWITVKWASTPTPGRCGQSTVASDGGWIELSYLSACSCGGPSRVYPRVVRHELGHAFGYYHTGSPDDVMYGKQIEASACDLQPSERERLYAKYVYSRP